MNVVDKIKEILKHKKPRYISEVYIRSSLSKDELEEFYNFTDFSYFPTLSERIYCIINDIRKRSECAFCGKRITSYYFSSFDIDQWVYQSTCCCKECTSKLKGQWPPQKKYKIDFTKMFGLINEGVSKCSQNVVCVYNFYEYINKNTNIDVSLIKTISEAYYIIKNGLIEYPKCYCGEPLKYKFNGEYSLFCSKECSDKSEHNKKKRKNTCIDKYGSESTFGSEEIKEKIKKTNLSKFGVDNPFKSKNIQKNIKETNLEKYGFETALKNEDVKQKSISTNLKKYGVTISTKSDEIKEKIKKTNQLKYGGNSPSQSEEIKNKIKKNSIEKYGVDSVNKTLKKRNKTSLTNKKKGYVELKNRLLENKIELLCNEEDYIGVGASKRYEYRCLVCEKVYTKIVNYNPNSAGVPLCPYCNSGISKPEMELTDFLNLHGIDHEKNNRKVISPYELDIYIPSHYLGIEYNGLYWHSQKNIDSDYHLNKTIMCEDVGIKLIHIFSDEYTRKPDIVKSRILNILGKSNERIYARKCKIKEISSKDKDEFLDRCHLQGADKSKINLGLFFEDRLVSVMTFCKLRKALGRTSKKDYWELSRFSNELNLVVIGGASKLLKYFENKYAPKCLISYADRRWSKGNLYKELGFDFDGYTKPNYFYTKDFLKREHRFKYRKNNLHNLLENFNSEKTEKENMSDNGFNIIYDCGHLRFIKNY